MYETDEVTGPILHHGGQALRFEFDLNASVLVLVGERIALLVEEVVRAAASLEQVAWREVPDLHDEEQLVALVLAWEEGIPSKQLKSNTTDAPHVNGGCVLSAQYDLRSSIITRLDV